MLGLSRSLASADPFARLPTADSEVCVEVFPCWPYDTQSQMLIGKAEGHISPPDFQFFLPRCVQASACCASKPCVPGSPRVPHALAAPPAGLGRRLPWKLHIHSAHHLLQ